MEPKIGGTERGTDNPVCPNRHPQNWPVKTNTAKPMIFAIPQQATDHKQRINRSTDQPINGQ
jgi:hypothetical protein